MFVSVSDELQLFAQEIQNFISQNILRDLAKDAGFVQRTSKYQAKDLVALCVWMSQNVATTSLTQLSSCLEASAEVRGGTETIQGMRGHSGGKLQFQILNKKRK
ncbi:hypothetical protein BG07_5798 (plasmid) [Bacillus pseudomycoides]|nr:hypothetical protein DJ92_5809 [Bacillus pseudomycoides]AJI14469.1 hypothetical protein BG07_5798 [Bacillus pseudomycoides]